MCALKTVDVNLEDINTEVVDLGGDDVYTPICADVA